MPLKERQAEEERGAGGANHPLKTMKMRRRRRRRKSLQSLAGTTDWSQLKYQVVHFFFFWLQSAPLLADCMLPEWLSGSVSQIRVSESVTQSSDTIAMPAGINSNSSAASASAAAIPVAGDKCVLALARQGNTCS